VLSRDVNKRNRKSVSQYLGVTWVHPSAGVLNRRCFEEVQYNRAQQTTEFVASGQAPQAHETAFRGEAMEPTSDSV
jgi:hypothetical protein